MNMSRRPWERFVASAVVLITALHWSVPAWALPSGTTVEHGSVTCEQTDAHSVHCHIESDQAILSHARFDIAQLEGVHFHFHNPTATSSILNRVTGGQLSTITGALLSNGQVFLINPAGIYITDTARIDTAGFVASTLNITNQDFLARIWQFEQDPDLPPASVVNQGTILARPGDLIGLLGGAVQNSGLLVAELGSVTLVSGSQVTLSFDQSGWLAVAVSQPVAQLAVGPDGQPVSSAIEQTGSIFAPGGQILIHARAVEGLFNRLVNLPSGVIEAVTVVAHNGRIYLTGDGGMLYTGGTIRADGTPEAPDGGEISVRADRVEQAGAITANAAEGGQAGQVSLTAKDSVALRPGSRLEAKASGAAGQGGSVRVASEQPKQSGSVRFEEGSVIDVSGGSSSGDAGSVELSAAEVRFDGQAVARAQEGYFGGRLLVDPLHLIFAALGIAPADAAAGTPDIAHGDPPAGGTTTVAIPTIVGFAEAFFQAVLDITVDAPLVMDTNNDLRMEAGRDILLNASVQVKGNGGVMTLIADADFSGSGGPASDGDGTIVQAVGAQILSDKGTLTLETGEDFTVNALVKGSGEVHITSHMGNILDDGDASTFVQAKDLFLTADAAGMGVGTTGLLDVDLNGELTLAVGSGGAAVHDQGDSFTLVSTAVAPGGSLDIRADKRLEVEGAHAVTGAGGIALTADADGDGSGALQMKSGSSLSSESGDIVLSNSEKMELRTITSVSGDIAASSDDNITVKGPSAISTGGAGTITMIADSDMEGHGHFSMDSGSSLMTDAGDIFVSTAIFGGASEAELELQTVTSTSGDITALSGRGIRIRELVSTGGAGAVFMDADANLDGSGQLRMSSGSVLSTVGGDIDLRDAGEMILQTVTSATGDICVHSWDDINVRGPISTGGAGMITLWADSDLSGLGTIKQDSLSDDITTDSGQILLWGANGAKIKDITSTSGNIFVWLTNADANMRLDGLISTGGSVELFAGGDIRDDNGGALNVFAGGDAEFTALNGTIGSAGDPLDVLIGGFLDVAAGGVEGGISVNLAGVVGGGVGGPPPTPPHLVAALGYPAGGPVPPGPVLLNGVPLALAGAIGPGFDADTTCITGLVVPPPPPILGGGPPPVISVLASLLDFLFDVENRRRYRGFVI